MKFETNEAFVLDLMNQSPYGGLCQGFIIEAIRYYSEQVAKTPEPVDDGTSFINPVAWRLIAIDISKRMEDQYGAKEEPPTA
jgi:hypothetical protein